MVVVQDQLLSWHFLAFLQYKLSHLIEVALGCGYLLGVDVATLECGKIELCWARLISIGPYHAHGQPELLN